MKTWLVVLLIALAGCSSPDEPKPDSDPKDPGLENPTTPVNPGPTGPVDFLLDYDFKDCQGSFFSSDHEASQLQGLVPEGYTASTQILAVILECGNFTTPQVILPDTVFGFIGVWVEDPGFGGAGVQIYMLETLTAEDVLAQLWTIAGFQTLNGTAAISDDSFNGFAIPLVTSSRVCLDAICIDTTAAVIPIDLIIGDVTLYHESEDYRLQWTGTFDMDFAYDGAGESSFPGSVAATMAGAGHGWFGTGEFTGNNLVAFYQ